MPSPLTSILLITKLTKKNAYRLIRFIVVNAVLGV